MTWATKVLVRVFLVLMASSALSSLALGQTATDPPAAQAKPATAAPFLIDAAGGANQPELALVLSAGGMAPFSVIRQAAPADSKFSLTVSALRDAQGQLSRAMLSVADGAPKEAQQELGLASGVLPVTLHVSPPMPAAPLTGTMTLVSAATVQTWPLRVQAGMARPATLAVDTPAQTLHITHCWFWCGPAGSERDFSVGLRDKSRTSPLENVWVRVDQLAKAGDGFSLTRDVAFRFNNVATNLTTSATGTTRDVPPGSVATVQGTLTNLKPAEYNVTLRFGAVNSGEDDAQKMTLSIFSKDEALIPLLVLVASVLASFVATKFVAGRRERLQLRSRIADLDASWLRNEPPLSAVIWAQANLRLAKSALGSSWTRVPDLVTERIKAVEGTLPTLRSIRDLRRAIDLASPHRFVARRADGRLGRLWAQCADPPVGDGVLKQIGERLTALQSWASPERAEVFKQYWMDVRSSIDALVGRVEPNLGDTLATSDRTDLAVIVADLKKVLEDNKLPTDAASPVAVPNGAIDIEQKYAALEKLWDNRTAPELFGKLLAEFKQSRDVEKLFKIADDDAWAKIKAAAGNPDALRIALPPGEPQQFEQFTVCVTTGDRSLDSTFLFKSGVRFAWEIEFTRRFFFNRWKLKDVPFVRETIRPESIGPALTQYSRWRGEAKISVTLWNGADSCRPSRTETLPIRKSAAFRTARGFEVTEIIPLVLAMVVAVVTGMSTLYAANATFGSLGDYLALFLWGAAVDQGKNALQQATQPGGATQTAGATTSATAAGSTSST